MNGEVPSVPITTLAGIGSLTDLLPELPLPKPVPSTMHNKSLLYSSKLAEESHRILSSGDTALAQQLVQALGQTSTSHIELKDSLAGDAIEGDVPNLLKVMLATDPSIFKRRRGSERGSSHRGQNFVQQKGHPTPVSPYQNPSFSPYPQNSSRASKQSNPYLQHETPTPVNQYPQASEILNGEHSQESFPQQNDQSRKAVVNSGQITVSSPAQGTVAESLSRRQVSQQPSSSCVSKSSHLESASRTSSRRQSQSRSSDPVVILEPLDSQTRVHQTHLKQADDVIVVDSPDPEVRSTRHSSKKSTESVVLLEPFDKQTKTKASKKGSGPVVVLEPLDAMVVKDKEKTLQSIKFGGSVKALSDSSRQRRLEKYKNRKAKRGYAGDSDDDISTSRKRRRIYRDDSSGESEYSDADDDGRPVDVRRKKKEKRHKRVNQVALTIDELLDSPTFKRFSNSMEYIFDSAEDINFGSLDPDDEEVECPPESLISKSVLTELCGEAAKLKSMAVVNKIPADKLVKLLTILQWNVRDGTKLLPSMAQDVEDEEEQKLWREVAMERVMRSMDSSLTAIYIMTSLSMPKQVYLEDVIERIIQFAKFQLHNTIYPEFDPVYRIDPKAKDGYHSSYKLKRARAGQVKHKSTINLYNKLSDVVENLAELVEIQELTDTVILQVSTLGVSTFFVENISELQLNAMKLVTTVFSKYQKHRQLILEDIFASLARLPSSKRNLRNYRLNSEESIQMVTALALQLIQCVIKLPAKDSEPTPAPVEEEDKTTPKKAKQKGQQQSPKAAGLVQTDADVIIVTSYETAMRTGHNFLSVFLKKCTIKGGEEDYRPLFENFVQDLLSTVNKPEWPSSELLLSLLGRILVQQFSNKSVDMSLRVASLEYLGIVAARLRKDAVSSQLKQEMIDEIVEKVNESDSDSEVEDRNQDDSKSKRNTEDESKDQTQSLQKAVLNYLAYNGHNEPAYLFARQFYIAQWYRDSTVEAEKKTKDHRKDEDDDLEDDEMEVEITSECVEDTERRKTFLLLQVDANLKPFSSFKPSPSKLDYESSCLVARYLSSKRPFAQSFDIYLTQILRVLSETAVAVRTKAMKCLTAVVESDPGILARSDMQKGVHGRFLDQSTSVREAAVELVGKFILIRPELIPKYYDMLSERILDTGISVRKRVIKIFRDICLEHTDFNKIPEMCVKMIRRVNDEEGIKKLVNEVFQSMWFTAVSTRGKDAPKLLQKVVNVTEVVAACKDTGYEFFEQLLENLLKKDEDGNFNKGALIACEQMVDCLVEHVLRIEEKSVESNEGKGCSSRLVSCLSTLYLFSKIKADLMVHHATTLQPYLDIKCSTQGDYWVLHYVARILEMVVPLMDHPSESFLAQLEEDMMKLILKHGMMVLQSCVSCLGAVVNCVSNNYPLVKDCFQKFFGVLCKLMADHKDNPENPTLQNRKPTLLRSLFTVGLLCKHFDFDAKEMGDAKYSVRDKVFDVLYYFIHHEDEEVQHKALTGMGFTVVRHYELMMGKMMKELYNHFLNDETVPIRMRCQVLKNLTMYLTEEEVRMQKADAEWKKHAKEEDLKEMGDVQSGMASTITQIYLKQVLEAFFHQNAQIRMAALSVIVLVLRQGLVHPVQCVPYLLSMGTDPEAAIRIKADQQLQDIEKKYPGFIHMKALQGIKLSYRIQKLLQDDPTRPVRGIRSPDENTQSLNSYLYTVLRGNRSHRRAILTSLLNQFDDSATISLAEQVYLADNLAYFPYQTQDESLFIIHQIDLIVSVSGSNLLQSFKELMFSQSGSKTTALPQIKQVEGEPQLIDDDDEDDPDLLIERMPADITPFKEICQLSQGCILLLVLKQHLKDMYGYTDSKIHRYSPAEIKTYDKPVNRRPGVKFNPEHTIKLLAQGSPENSSENDKKLKIVEDYLEFKELMLNIDPPDEDESEDNKSTGRQTPTPGRQKNPEGGGDATENKTGDGDGVQGDVIEIHDENSTGAGAAPPPKPHSTPVHPPIKTTIHLKSSRHFNSEKKKKSRSRHSSGPSSASKVHSSAKKKKKRKKRYGSDSDDDYSSDNDPDFVL